MSPTRGKTERIHFEVLRQLGTGLSQEPEVVEGASVVEGDGPVAGFVLELRRLLA